MNKNIDLFKMSEEREKNRVEIPRVLKEESVKQKNVSKSKNSDKQVVILSLTDKSNASLTRIKKKLSCYLDKVYTVNAVSMAISEYRKEVETNGMDMEQFLKNINKKTNDKEKNTSVELDSSVIKDLNILKEELKKNLTFKTFTLKEVINLSLIYYDNKLKKGLC